MKEVIAVIGYILGNLTILGYIIIGFLLLNAGMGVAGVIMGIFLPIPAILGFWASTFTSWSAFIGTVIWWALIYFMVAFGEE